jgi:hypothetical protein
MDLTAAQRKAIFGLIVVVLAGLGIYLFASSGHSGGPPAAAPSPRQHAPAAPAARATSPAAPSASAAPAAAADV